MKKHDKSGDGVINYNEFIYMINDILMGQGYVWGYYDEKELNKKFIEEWDAINKVKS